MEERKYELVKDNSINYRGIKLYRIKALRSFGNIRKGDIGGYIEKETNLSHEDNCWVYNNAKVFDNARVCDNAKVFDNAIVCDNAIVSGNAMVLDDAKLFDNAFVCDNAKLHDNAKVYGNAKIFNNAKVCGHAKLYDNTKVCDHAKVYGEAEIYGNCLICDRTVVYDDATISNTIVSGNAQISGNAIISSDDDYITIKGLGSYNRDTTFFRCKDNIISVNCGCFNGTLDEFINKVNKTHKDNNKYREEYLLQVEVVKRHFNIKEKENK